MKQIFKKIIDEVARELLGKFDENFGNRSFFGEKWKGTNSPNQRGTLMVRTGKLRHSIRANINGNSIHFTSALEYASIHNNGGEIVVTAKMKRFFWAMHYKAAGGADKYLRGKTKERLTKEAQYWKSLALMKVGAKMKIEKRQFIGDHPQVKKVIEDVVEHHKNDIEIAIKNLLKQRR